MSDKPVFEVPEWDDFYNTWKIVIILLALVLLLLMLFGLGPGGRCSQVTAGAACNAVSESDGTETTTMVGEEQTVTKEKADASTTAMLPAEVKVEKTVNEEVLETAISKEEKSGQYLKVNSTKQKVYFATDSYELPEGYAKPLKSIVIKMISDNRWVAVISGFHDETGSLSYNQELAKMRAIAVRDALASVGINPSRIILEKPQSTLGKGSNAEARRVEVILADLVDD